MIDILYLDILFKTDAKTTTGQANYSPRYHHKEPTFALGGLRQIQVTGKLKGRGIEAVGTASLFFFSKEYLLSAMKGCDRMRQRRKN